MLLLLLFLSPPSPSYSYSSLSYIMINRLISSCPRQTFLFQMRCPLFPLYQQASASYCHHPSDHQQGFNSIAGLLPLITQLTFGKSFNYPFKYLPSLLKGLTFGYYFNQPFDSLGCIPHSPHLTSPDLWLQIQLIGQLSLLLYHSTYFWNLLRQLCVPSPVTHLTFGERFDQYVNSLPLSHSARVLE